MMSTWREGQVDTVACVLFIVIAESMVLLDSWDLKIQKCSKSLGITVVFTSSSRTSAQLGQSMCQKKKKPP